MEQSFNIAPSLGKGIVSGRGAGAKVLNRSEHRFLEGPDDGALVLLPENLHHMVFCFEDFRNVSSSLATTRGRTDLPRFAASLSPNGNTPRGLWNGYRVWHFDHAEV